MSTRIIRTAIFAAVTLGAPAVAAADSRPATVAVTHAPKAAVGDEAASYSQRETQDPQAAQFEGGMIESTGGGGVVVISGVALVAFVLLAIMLL
jgi:hypothetical protein